MSKVITIAAAAYAAFLDAEIRKSIGTEMNVPPESVTLPDTFDANQEADGSISVSLSSLSINFAAEPAVEAAPATTKGKGRKAKATAAKGDAKPAAAAAPRKGAKVFNPDRKGRPPAFWTKMDDKSKDAYRKMNAADRKAYMVKVGALSK